MLHCRLQQCNFLCIIHIQYALHLAACRLVFFRELSLETFYFSKVTPVFLTKNLSSKLRSDLFHQEALMMPWTKDVSRYGRSTPTLILLNLNRLKYGNQNFSIFTTEENMNSDQI